MANFKVERADLFPSGTVVKAYQRNQAHLPQVGAPAGTAVAEATMGGSPPTATLENLVAGGQYVCYAAVSGVDTYLGIAVPSVAPNPTIMPFTANPVAQGLLGWAYDPVAAADNELITATAGTLHVTSVYVPEACQIKNILMMLTKKGATLTASQCGLGLFESGTRKLLSSVAIAELITAWEGADKAVVSLPLVVPQSVAAGKVFVGWYYNGTTAPSFALALKAANDEAIVNAGKTANASRFATADTGLTTALPNPTAALVADTAAYWAAVS